MKIIRAFKAAIEEFTAALDLRAQEIRSGITLIEAVEVDAFETQLRALTTDETMREGLREGILMLAMSGISPEEIEPMMRQYRTMPYRMTYELMQVRRYVDMSIERANAYEGARQ